MPDTDYLIWRLKPQLNNSSRTRQHHGEITESYPFVVLINLFTTTHNLLTFNISEMSSNNSEKLLPIGK